MDKTLSTVIGLPPAKVGEMVEIIDVADAAKIDDDCF